MTIAWTAIQAPQSQRSDSRSSLHEDLPVAVVLVEVRVLQQAPSLQQA